MKRKIDAYFPVGADYKKDIQKLLAGYGGIIFVILVGYFMVYYSQHSTLFQRAYGEEIVREGAMMVPFLDIYGGYSIIACYGLGVSLCLVMARSYYQYHTKGSQSIYLMRRLPDKWELHRRCLTMPAVAAVFILVTMILLTFCCYLHYMIVTPPECLYPNHWGTFF